MSQTDHISYDVLFRDSLKIQIRVVKALILREILTRYGRSNLGFLWLFLEPMMFTVGIIVLRSLVIRNTQPQEFPLAGFLLTGYLSFILFRNITNRLSKGVSSNLGLLYHSNVKIIDILLSRFILEFCGLSGAFIFLSFVFIYFNLIDVPDSIMWSIVGWLFIAWFSLVFGIVIAYLQEASKLFERIWSLILLALLPFSGVFFMVSWMPKEYQDLILWFPLVNGIELLREGFLGEKTQAMYSISYLIFSNLSIMLLGLILIKKHSALLEQQ